MKGMDRWSSYGFWEKKWDGVHPWLLRREGEGVPPWLLEREGDGVHPWLLRKEGEGVYPWLLQRDKGKEIIHGRSSAARIDSGAAPPAGAGISRTWRQGTN